MTASIPDKTNNLRNEKQHKTISEKQFTLKKRKSMKNKQLSKMAALPSET
jgi:hypothetical protein